MKTLGGFGLAVLAIVGLAGAAAAPTATSVEIKHFKYGPETITVPVGATVDQRGRRASHGHGDRRVCLAGSGL